MSKILTVIALVVLMLVPLAWWRGRTQTDGLALVTPAGNLHGVGVHRGLVLVLMTDIPVRSRGEGGVKRLWLSPDAFDQMVETLHRNDESQVNLLGVRCTSGTAAIRNLSPAGGRVLVILPPWVVCLAAAGMLFAPAMKRRHPPGHCRACGYDLRSSVQRCSECGTAIENSLAERAGNH